MNHKPITTPKGTELPLMDFRGKAYLEVKYRLVWFREEHPDWGIETELLLVEPNKTIAKATVRNAEGRIIGQGTKAENVQGFPDHLEKAETGSIGRALALCGYGTQFEPDLDESREGKETRIVDCPVERAPQPSTSAHREPIPVSHQVDLPGDGDSATVFLTVANAQKKVSEKSGTEYWQIDTDMGKMTSFAEVPLYEGFDATVKGSLYNGKMTYTVTAVK